VAASASVAAEADAGTVRRPYLERNGNTRCRSAPACGLQSTGFPQLIHRGGPISSNAFKDICPKAIGLLHMGDVTVRRHREYLPGKLSERPQWQAMVALPPGALGGGRSEVGGGRRA
jgi:hypothetical protein